MVTQSLKLLILVLGILMIVVSSIQQYSTGQESLDYFMLSCDNITSQANQLLESKGPVQRNLLDLKNMTFLMNLYSINCA
ncbi:MAG: hypothetical protein ACRD8W_22220 [Nitrososphaeraceae archaeon]